MSPPDDAGTPETKTSPPAPTTARSEKPDASEAVQKPPTTAVTPPPLAKGVEAAPAPPPPPEPETPAVLETPVDPGKSAAPAPTSTEPPDPGPATNPATSLGRGWFAALARAPKATPAVALAAAPAAVKTTPTIGTTSSAPTEPKVAVAPKDTVVAPRTPATGPFLVKSEDASGEIRIDPKAGVPPPTAEQNKFLTDLMGVERLVLRLYPVRRWGSNSERSTIQRRLLYAAQLGLQKDPPDEALARTAMTGIVDDALAVRGAAARSRHLRDYGIWCLVMILVTAAACVGYAHLHELAPQLSSLAVSDKALTRLWLAMSALLAGAWLTATARAQPEGAEAIGQLLGGTLKSHIRVPFIAGYGFVAILLLHAKVVVFTIGGGNEVFTTAEVLDRISTALICGALLGLGEAVLPDAIGQRSANLVGILSGKSAP